MLKKEDAKRAYVTKALCPTQCNFIIDEIYDSIGSCGTCDRWEQFAPTDGRESSLGQCYLGNDMDNIWGIDDYCSRFERKQE